MSSYDEQAPGPHILLLEDERVQARVFSLWLKSGLNATVVTCSTPTEAKEALRTQPFDLVITDVELGDGSQNGIEFAKKVIARKQCALVALLTSHDRFDYAAEALRSGVADILLKPKEKETLVAWVRKVLAVGQAQRRRILAIGAHPDDIEIGCGGTLLKHRRDGDEVMMLTLTSGAGGGETEIRLKEARAVADFMGAQIRFADLPDRQLSGGGETISVIEQAIADFEPDVVFTHSRHDVHQDHRAAHEATLVAARGVPTVLCYQSPSTTIDFRPSTFVDIGRDFNRKLKAIGFHESQTSKCDYLDPELLRATARYWARFTRGRYVEPFEALRITTERRSGRSVMPIESIPPAHADIAATLSLAWEAAG